MLAARFSPPGLCFKYYLKLMMVPVNTCRAFNVLQERTANQWRTGLLYFLVHRVPRFVLASDAPLLRGTLLLDPPAEHHFGSFFIPHASFLSSGYRL